MDIKEFRVTRLKEFVTAQGGAAAVQKKYGIDASYLWQLLNLRRPFGEKSARNIEFKCALPINYFDDDSLNNKIRRYPDNSFIINETKVKAVPVFGKGMGGLPDRLFSDEGRPVNGHDEFAEVYSIDISAFVVKVEGNSMYPKFEHGQYALVEPNTPPEIEDNVIVKTIKGEVMIKRLISRRGGIVLASYNEPQTYTFKPEELVWMYYVAHEVPARKINQRL
jgi:SOS-response transcriptional repressor LexA